MEAVRERTLRRHRPRVGLALSATALFAALSLFAGGKADAQWPPVVLDGNAGNNVIEIRAFGDRVEFCTDGFCFDLDRFEVPSVTVNGHEGNDVLVIDHAGSMIVGAEDPLPISFDGGPPGSGSDRLELCPWSCDGSAIQTTVYSPSGSPGQGLVTQDDGSGQSVHISFAHVASLVDASPGRATVLGTGASNAIGLATDQGNVLTTVDASTPYQPSGKSDLTIDAAAGDDTIALEPGVGSAGLTELRVRGGDGAADRLVIRGSSDADRLAYEPSAADRADIETDGAPKIDARTVERLSYVGGGGSDDLILTTPENNTIVTFSPGTNAGSGLLTARQKASDDAIQLLPLEFSDVGGDGNVRVKDATGGREDTLLFTGLDTSTASDTIEVDAGAGRIRLLVADTSIRAALDVEPSGAKDVVVDARGGDDSIIATGPFPFTLQTDGGAGADVVSLSGPDGPVALAPALGQIDGYGKPVRVLAERLRADVAGSDVSVTGTAGPDNAIFTPLTGSSGRISVDGSGLATDLLGASAGLVVDTADGIDRVTVNGTTAGDAIEVVRGDLTHIGVGALRPLSVPAASTESLDISSGSGDDAVRVSGSGGPAALSISDASGPTDSLRITGLTDAKVSPGLVSDPAGAVAHMGIDGLELEGAGGPLTILGTDNSDSIAQDGATVLVNDGPTVSYQGFGSLALSARGGDDRVSVDPATAAVTGIAVNGGIATDELEVRGRNASDDFTVTPTGSDAGTVEIAGLPAVVFNGTESATFDGARGGDAFTLVAKANDDTIQYAPAAAPDAGAIRIDTLVPIRFADLGSAGQVSIDGRAGNDTLVFRGSDSDDAFSVTPDGTIAFGNQAGSHLSVSPRAVEKLTMDAVGGADAFTVPGGHPYASVRALGGDPADGDTIIFNGSGAPISVDLGAPAIREHAPVLLSGVESASVRAAGASIEVIGTDGSDSIRYTPTTSTSGHLSRDGANLNFDLTDVPGPLTLDPRAGTDHVLSSGTPGPDAVAVVRGNIASVAVGTLKPIQIVSASTEALTVQALEGDDRISIDGSGGPGSLAIDGGGQQLEDTLSITGLANADVSSASVAALDANVGHVGVERVSVEGNDAGMLTVAGTDGDDAISQAGAEIRIGAAPPVSYNRFAALDIRGAGGDDRLSVVPAQSGVGRIGFDGGAGTDALLAAGSTSFDDVLSQPTGADAGRLGIAGAPEVVYSTTESATVDGKGGGDTLRFAAGAGDDTITYSPADTADAGMLRISSLIPTGFAALGDGTVRVDGGGGLDTLVHRGTPGDDALAVAADGSILLTGVEGTHVPVHTGALERLTIDALAGGDAVRVAGQQPYALLRSEGGDGPDSLRVDGSGGPVEVDLGGGMVREVNPVLFTATESITADAAGAAIDVTGSSGPETVRFTPTSADGATITRDGSPVILAVTSIGEPLVLDSQAGADLVIVSAQPTPDAVAISRGGLTTVAVGDLQRLTVPAASTETLRVDGNEGDDVLSVSGAGGPGTLSIVGGSATDTLIVTGQRDVTTAPGFIAATGGDVGHSAIERIIVEGTDDGEVTVTGGDTNDAISQSAGSVFVNAEPPVSYSRFARLGVRALAGNDQITTVPSQAAVSTMEVDAGTGTDNLVVTGDVTPDAVAARPTASDAGIVALDGRPPVSFSGTEAVLLDGRGGGDRLTLVGGAADDVTTYTPEATVDAGRLQIGSLVPLRFQSLGSGAVTLDGRGGTDTLVYRGTGADDSFSVGAAGLISFAGATGVHVPVDTTGVEALTIDTLAGGDTATISGANPYDPVRIEGGDGSDSLRFNGSGGPVRTDLGTHAVQEIHPVRFTGIESLRTDAGGASVIVEGSPGGDALAYTPVTHDSGLLVREGSGPAVELQGVGALTLDPGDGADLVTVAATSAADTVEVHRGDPTRVSVAGLLPILVPEGRTESLVARAQDGDDQLILSGAGGPGSVTVDGGPGIDRFVLSGQPDVSSTADRLLSTGGTVAHTAVEEIALEGTGAGTLTFTATDAPDTVQQAGNEVTVNAGLPVSFSGYPDLKLVTGGGTDALQIRPTTLVGVRHITLAAGGGADLLGVQGSPADERIVFTPTSGSSGQVHVAGTPPIDITSTESVDIDGASAGSGGDDLTIDSSAIFATLVLTPATALDAGRVEVQQGAPVLNFAGLGSGRLAFADAFRADNLVYMGTNSNDSATVDAGGVLTHGTRIPVGTPGIAALRMEMFGGDDIVTVAGDHPFPGTDAAPGIQIDAGQGTDTARLAGAGGQVSLDYATQIMRQAGFGTIGTSGVEKVDTDVSGARLDVNGAGGSDTVCFEPLHPDAGRLRATEVTGTDGSCPADLGTVIYDVTSVGSLFVDPGAGIDEVLIQGTSAADEIRLVNTDAGHPGFATVVVDSVNDAPALLPAHISTSTAEAVRLAAGAGSDVVAATVYSDAGPIFRLDGETPDASKESDALTVCDGSGGDAQLQNKRSRVPYAGTVIADYSGQEVRLEYRSMEDVTLLKRLAADGTCHKDAGGGGSEDGKKGNGGGKKK